jgi:hypothetical protein
VIRLRRAWIDAHIGWHQGAAEKAERAAARHREQERRWREQFEARWPNPYRRP